MSLLYCLTCNFDGIWRYWLKNHICEKQFHSIQIAGIVIPQSQTFRMSVFAENLRRSYLHADKVRRVPLLRCVMYTVIYECRRCLCMFSSAPTFLANKMIIILMIILMSRVCVCSTTAACSRSVKFSKLLLIMVMVAEQWKSAGRTRRLHTDTRPQNNIVT